MQKQERSVKHKRANIACSLCGKIGCQLQQLATLSVLFWLLFFWLLLLSNALNKRQTNGGFVGITRRQEGEQARTHSGSSVDSSSSISRSINNIIHITVFQAQGHCDPIQWQPDEREAVFADSAQRVHLLGELRSNGAGGPMLVGLAQAALLLCVGVCG